jgi:hypothetical protein
VPRQRYFLAHLAERPTVSESVYHSPERRPYSHQLWEGQDPACPRVLGASFRGMTNGDDRAKLHEKVVWTEWAHESSAILYIHMGYVHCVTYDGLNEYVNEQLQATAAMYSMNNAPIGQPPAALLLLRLPVQQKVPEKQLPPRLMARVQLRMPTELGPLPLKCRQSVHLWTGPVALDSVYDGSFCALRQRGPVYVGPLLCALAAATCLVPAAAASQKTSRQRTRHAQAIPQMYEKYMNVGCKNWTISCPRTLMVTSASSCRRSSM